MWSAAARRGCAARQPVARGRPGEASFAGRKRKPIGPGESGSKLPPSKAARAASHTDFRAFQDLASGTVPAGPPGNSSRVWPRGRAQPRPTSSGRSKRRPYRGLRAGRSTRVRSQLETRVQSRVAPLSSLHFLVFPAGVARCYTPLDDAPRQRQSDHVLLRVRLLYVCARGGGLNEEASKSQKLNGRQISSTAADPRIAGRFVFCGTGVAVSGRT